MSNLTGKVAKVKKSQVNDGRLGVGLFRGCRDASATMWLVKLSEDCLATAVTTSHGILRLYSADASPEPRL